MTPRQIRRAAERKAANRANAQSSTGPKTEQGKAISSQNALKTALTGRTVLLPTDDRARYQQHLTHYFHFWKPVGEHECALVQLIADTWWRLLRIPCLEAALFAKGHHELASECDPNLLRLEIYLKYEKQFRNLALQERRLSNYAARLKAELEEVKGQRQTEDEAANDVPEFEFSAALDHIDSPDFSPAETDSLQPDTPDPALLAASLAHSSGLPSNR